ncbi:MAG TPA: malic enzyme-like NAD(P)-binding protein, partial [Thermomicrobiales bacterium]|nr:malic enzyme-like NAD(P)-binding protein [Thermomicrobiales bacterium]
TGVIGIASKVPIKDRSVLSIVYTPGVAEPCLAIARDPNASFDLTSRGNTVAIVTDGSALFGHGDSPPEASLPVMEGRSVLFKTFAGIDAFPICLGTHDIQQIVHTLYALTPTFGAIGIEAMTRPYSFTVADHLEKAAGIPVFSNQHHAAAVVVLAGLYNALEVVGKRLEEATIVINGAGVGGIGVARVLVRAGAKEVIVCDRVGAIYPYRPERMDWAKAYVAKETNLRRRAGTLAEMLVGADAFVGLSAGDVLTAEMVRSMADDPIVFALATPTPEIDPEEARRGGARVIATSRSDYPNQLDVALVFPGVFRGLLDSRARNINMEILTGAARALAGVVPADRLHAENIIPPIFDFRVAPAIAAAVVEAASASGEARKDVDPAAEAERTRRIVYEGVTPNTSVNGRRERGGTLQERAMNLRRRYGGMLEIKSKIPVKDRYILNMLYVPPAAVAPAEEIRRDPMQVYNLTAKGNLIAIVTDGSAVLGLGDIGPQAALPVMEGKAVLFSSLSGVEAFPICLAARHPDEIVDIVKAIAPTFGGVNLEDIAAPRCFEIEARLQEALDIPVFHDDQHGTAVVVLAALLNALKLAGKEIGATRIVINGTGAAGIAVAKLLLAVGAGRDGRRQTADGRGESGAGSPKTPKTPLGAGPLGAGAAGQSGDIILCDRAGAVYKGRRKGMNPFKDEIAALTNRERRSGALAEVLPGADIFIGVSAPGALSQAMIQTMAPDPIVFALANPIPEIEPGDAKAAGALVVATGRSDHPNQVNNSLAFPGIFRGALDVKARRINDAMKIAAAHAIADLVAPDDLEPDFIIPDSLSYQVPPKVAAAVARAAIETGEAKVPGNPDEIEEHAFDLVYEGSLS